MIGQTISHYNILEKVGEGGMGVVYRARDTKLDRDVALKFLPGHMSASEQDKARFMQEAKAAATLDHPNICTIYSIEEHGGQLFIAMQYVDGQLLRDRMGSMTMKQAMEIGIQVSEGLSAAHEKGIVHRDIKPENIMVRRDGIVQIMDFGLAKLKGVSRLTKEGSTVGTAGYMSPEQIQGQEADHRSDIFSLGVLLYEMFTGQLPFKGIHETAIAYEIVNVDALPMAAVKPEVDPVLDAIVLECLEKDPNERTQSARQVGIDLKRVKRESSRQRASRITAVRPVPSSSAAGGPSSEGAHPELRRLPSKRSISPFLTLGIALVALLAGYGISNLWVQKADTPAVLRASIGMPQGIQYNDRLGGHSAISPDGTMIVFVGWDSLSQNRLWVRPLDVTEAKVLSGTENAQYPFWSPDSRSIGFFADGKLKTIDARGGPVLALADAPFGRGGAWSKNGEIVFSPSLTDPNLFAVPSSGGGVRPVTAFDSTLQTAPRFPSFLPDGNHFFFSNLSLQGSGSESNAFIGALDNRESREIMKGVAHPLFASGYLLFLRQGILMAQPFDPGSMEVSGSPTSVQGNINSWLARAKADFSVSGNGILLYAGSATGNTSELVWIEPDGSESPIVEAEPMTGVTLSLDGTRIAYDEHDGQVANIWVYDTERRVKTRVTFETLAATTPRWSRDGTMIYYNMEVGGSKAHIAVRRSDGSGEQEMLASGEPGTTVGYYPEDISPDGRFLLITLRNESGSELGTLDLNDARRPLPVVKLGIRGSRAQFSPDGKWIAYQTNESGVERVYVSSFGGTAGKWQVSSNAAAGPHWVKNGIAYFSRARDRNESCDISFTSGIPEFSEPKPLFPGGGRSQGNIIYSVSGDTKKYLGLRRTGSGSGGDLSLVVNWPGLLKAH
jgi:serine/threonine protein kinase